MVPVVALLLMVMLTVAAARAAMMRWARVPIGTVHIDDRVELRVAARLLDSHGRCDGDGQLTVSHGLLEVTMGGAVVVSAPVAEVRASVHLAPRPSVALSGHGWTRLVVVDRVRPVPVVVGSIGRERQITTAQVVIGALGESVREGNFGVGEISPYRIGPPASASATATAA